MSIISHEVKKGTYGGLNYGANWKYRVAAYGCVGCVLYNSKAFYLFVLLDSLG